MSFLMRARPSPRGQHLFSEQATHRPISHRLQPKAMSNHPSLWVVLLLLGIASFLTAGLTPAENPAVVFHDNTGCTILLPTPYPPSEAGVVTRVLTPTGRTIISCNAKMPAGALLPKASLTFSRGDCFFRLTPGGRSSLLG